MQSKKALVLTLTVVGVVLVGGVGACVGDEPQVSTPDASPTTTPTGTTTATGTTAADGAVLPPPTDGAVSLDATPDGATPLDASVDAAPDVVGDAAPSIACVEGVLGSGGAVQRCSASEAAVSPAGTIPVGTYKLSRAKGGLYCTATYFIGSAEVFLTPTGELMMRYIVFRRTVAGETGIKVAGTAWLRGGGSTFSRVEMCDVGRVGETDVGSLQSTVIGGAPVFTLTFPRSPGAQEEWTKLP